MAESEREKDRKTLRREIEEMEDELALLQRHCRELGVPVLLIFEGWSAAGKGTMINRVIQPMDPRGFKVSCISAPNRDEQLRPFLWRFWSRTPSADRMAIFDRSWYRSILDGAVNGVGALTQTFGFIARLFQTGRIQQYASFAVAGGLAVAAWLLLG